MSPPTRRVTIVDVAQRAQVSTTAVSKVLRNAYGTSATMRAKVHQAIAELGYRPYAAARGLRGQTYTIGVLVPDLRNPFFPDILDGLNEALRSTDYQVLLGPSYCQGERAEAKVVEAMIDRGMDGLVLIAPLTSRKDLERIARTVPTVVIGRHGRSAAYDTVVDDDRTGAALVVDHLADLGHRRIAHIEHHETDPTRLAEMPNAIRADGYRQAMTARGLAEHIEIVSTSYTQHGGYDGTRQLLARPQRPTAIFAGADTVAIGALQALTEAGLTVPGDISLAGYDNTTVAALGSIGLTSVDQAGHHIGATAARLLLERVADRERPSSQVKLSPRLVPRRTTGGVMDEDLRDRLARLTLEQKVRLLTGADFWTLRPEPAIGLRALVVSDGPAGVRGRTWDERDPSANVPSPTALAATWDEQRIERIGQLLAAEARRKGVDVLLAPTVNLHRTPYGGRHFECFSEEPLLSGRIGAAYVRGLQSNGVGGCVKHFVANDSETQRHTVDVAVDERTLRELYLAPFETIVREAGVWSVMAAYNGVNGHTMTESPLLRQVLHQEWDFDGLTMTDWYAARSLASAAAGLDLIMPGPGGPWGEALVAAVRAGRIAEAVVDDKVMRLLRLAARTGALDGIPGTEAQAWTPEQIAGELRATAAAGIVLARNDPPPGQDRPLLPVDAAALRTVAVLGANAAHARTLGGGSATVFPPYTVSPLDGLRAALGPGVTVVHARGGRIGARVAVADPALLRRPDGRPGTHLRFLAADGTELCTQDRTGAAYKWNSTVDDGVAVGDVATIEVTTRFHAPQAGRYLLGASGIGSLRLTVDGSVVAESRLTLPTGADFVESVMRPPQLIAPLDLSEGATADLVLRYAPVPASGLGAATVEAVTFQLNAERDSDDDAEIDAAVSLAADADLAVVVVGTTEEVESEGFDRTSLGLPGRQDELVRRVAAANPRTVAVVNSGAPVLLPWAADVPAIMLTWFPGQEFGNALADILTGITEAGGRLPVTWPDGDHGLPTTTPTNGTLPYTEGLLIGYRANINPRFPFGHGLGYTTWQYLAAAATATDVTVHLRNTGTRPGTEIVQIYASKPDTTIPRPPQWLAAWATVSAQPGEETTAHISLPARAFQHWTGGSWHTEPGTFALHIGHSSGDHALMIDIEPRSAAN